jgi:hypothetical protein
MLVFIKSYVRLREIRGHPSVKRGGPGSATPTLRNSAREFSTAREIILVDCPGVRSLFAPGFFIQFLDQVLNLIRFLRTGVCLEIQLELLNGLD